MNSGHLGKFVHLSPSTPRYLKKYLVLKTKTDLGRKGNTQGMYPCIRSDIKSCGKISIFSKLKIDPETPPHPLSLV